MTLIQKLEIVGSIPIRAKNFVLISVDDNVVKSVYDVLLFYSFFFRMHNDRIRNILSCVVKA